MAALSNVTVALTPGDGVKVAGGALHRFDSQHRIWEWRDQGGWRYFPELRSSIVAENRGGDLRGEADGISSSGFNLIGFDPQAFCSAVATAWAPRVRIDPLMGGFVGRTLGLNPASPAINAGDPSFDSSSQPATDGRGAPRLQDGRIDIGAHEAEISLASILEVLFGEDEVVSATVAEILARDEDGDGRITTMEIAEEATRRRRTSRGDRSRSSAA
ncbi:MAG: choice-of-anchor Q domain-containing protein [Verrucomicrobiales bacterium]